MFDKFMPSTLNAHMLAYFLCLLNSFGIALWFCVCKILKNGRTGPGSSWKHLPYL
jgi:hypothetical protein